jgi:hypothetical protein
LAKWFCECRIETGALRAVPNVAIVSVAPIIAVVQAVQKVQIVQAVPKVQIVQAVEDFIAASRAG